MTTKIYEFSMKCHQCGNKIVVRTDPEGCEYNYLEGAYRFVRLFFNNDLKMNAMDIESEDVQFLRDA